MLLYGGVSSLNGFEVYCPVAQITSIMNTKAIIGGTPSEISQLIFENISFKIMKNCLAECNLLRRHLKGSSDGETQKWISGN